MSAKKSPRSDRNRFEQLFFIFHNSIDLHEKSVKVIGKYAEKYDYEATKKLKTIANKAKNKKARITQQDIEILKEFLGKQPMQAFLFRKNTLVSIVSTLDELFASLFRYYYSEHPEKLSIENKSLTYAELHKMQKIDDAKSHILDREIDSVLLGEGIRSRFNILEKELGIKLPGNKKYLDSLEKLIKTRNLIVHNSCKADQDYVKRYGEKGMKKGDTVVFSRMYLFEAMALVLFTGGFILQVAQCKYSTKKLEPREFILNGLAHLLLKKERYEYLKEIYTTSKELEMDDLNKKMIVVNFCIGLKRQKRSRRHIMEVLSKEDWSAAGDDLKMCIAALKDDHKEFYLLLSKLIKNNIIRKDEILEWEIFSFYKKKSEFRELVKKVIS